MGRILAEGGGIARGREQHLGGAAVILRLDTTKKLSENAVLSAR